MLKLKDGVVWDGVDPEFKETLLTDVITIFDDLKKDMVITSLNDGKHMQGSYHYKGLAADFRIWNLSPYRPIDVRDMIQELLGKDYDVVLEKDHIHLEYDPV